MAGFRTTDVYAPTGDQPQAIEELSRSIVEGNRYQTLLGATGTGKTATMAWTIEEVGKPALIIAHNKTLAAQLCNEFREFFPDNAVEYFVSYYDYYQPEAYVPQADLYIEKDSSQNDDVLGRGRFRVKGDVLEVQPANVETAYRISFFGDTVEQITHFDPLTGEVFSKLDNLAIWLATEYVTSKPTIERAVDEIKHELEQQVKHFESENRLLEAHRIRQRTEYDLEMLQELGFCNGIENYS